MNFDTDRMLAEKAERRRRKRREEEERRYAAEHPSDNELYGLVDPLYDVFYKMWCADGKCNMKFLPKTYNGKVLNQENRFRAGVFFALGKDDGKGLQIVRNWYNNGQKHSGRDYIQLVLFFVDAFEKKGIWDDVPKADMEKKMKLIPMLLEEDIKKKSPYLPKRFSAAGGKKSRRKRRKSRRRKKKKSRRKRKKSRRRKRR